MGGGGVMDLICMCPSCVPNSLFLLWKEGRGKNEIDVMPSKVIGLSQVLKFLNIRIRVSGEGAKALFYLREVSKRKGNVDPHNAFHSSHFPERVDGNRLTGGSMRESVVGGSWDPVVPGEWKGGWKEGQEEEWEEKWEEGREPMAEQWKPVFVKVEAR
jgi:hypothetical protein